MEKLIFDRTEADIINNTSKGQYNSEDLNRVETWCKYLAETLTNYGYKVEITTKINWGELDYPYGEEIERIRNNVNTLKEAYFSFTQVPETLNKIDIDKANKIEKILAEINELIGIMIQTFVYSGVGGLGQNRVWQQRFRRGSLWARLTSNLSNYNQEWNTVASPSEEVKKEIVIYGLDNISVALNTWNNYLTELDEVVGTL